MTFFGLSFALGVLLAQRFKVFVLAPASLLLAISAFADGLAGTEPGWPKAVAAILDVASLQMGYLLGLAAGSLWLDTPTRTQVPPAQTGARELPMGPAPGSAH
jgi:hypothetical protein